MTSHAEVLISLRNGRAFVSRYTTDSNGSFSWESAINAEALEPEALEVVKAHGIAPEGHTDLPCPPELAARAQWYQDDNPTASSL